MGEWWAPGYPRVPTSERYTAHASAPLNADSVDHHLCEIIHNYSKTSVERLSNQNAITVKLSLGHQIC